MTDSKKRYIAPAFFFILIGGLTLWIIDGVMTGVAPTETMGTFIGIPVRNLISILIVAAIPILFVEYYLLAVPVAAGFIFINRTVKAASYEMNIMNIGKEFRGRHMVRRAVAPALFSVAFATMLSDIISPYLSTYIGDFVTEFFTISQAGIISLMSALLFMPVALLIFMPTWVLNDTGIVTHLKESKQTLRQSPDTQGIGRWVSSIFGGYALIAFPIAMFTEHLFNPHIEPFLTDGTIPATVSVLSSIILIGGLPIFVMAFIVPVVVLNEYSQARIRRQLGTIATRFGATVVKGERIKKTTRLSDDGILTEAAGLEVVSTAKSVKLAQTKEKNLKLAQIKEKEAISKAKKRAKEKSKATAQSVKSVKKKKSSKK